MATVTERHRERAREWLESHAPSVSNISLEPLAALLAEVEAPLQARCAALEAVMRRFAVASSRAGLLLARSNQALDAPASSISAELAIRETQEDVEAALSGSDSALKAMLVRAASDALHDGCESASEYACSSEPERDRWAEAIAERVMRGE